MILLGQRLDAVMCRTTRLTDSSLTRRQRTAKTADTRKKAHDWPSGHAPRGVSGGQIPECRAHKHCRREGTGHPEMAARKALVSASCQLGGRNLLRKSTRPCNAVWLERIPMTSCKL